MADTAVHSFTNATSLVATDELYLTRSPFGAGDDRRVSITNFMGTIPSTTPLGWSDVFLVRDGANTLALRNSTNAQVFNVYNTYTSSTNYERLSISWAANVVTIGTEKGSGGGTARSLVLSQGNPGANITLTAGDTTIVGPLLFPDNTYDIGASGATRPKTGYFGTGLVAPQIANSTGTLYLGGVVANASTTLAVTDSSGTGEITGLVFAAANTLGWSSSSNPAGAVDVRLWRDAANTLALRNSTNAQTFNIYNTFTDTSNYGRLSLAVADSGVVLGFEVAGTGAGRIMYLYNRSNEDLIFGTNNTSRWEVDKTGHFLASTDNTYDIGANGATRPKDLYLAGAAHLGGGIGAGGTITGTEIYAAAYYFGFGGGGTRGWLFAEADGVFQLLNNATTGFSRLSFGGATTSFPALARSGTALQACLADGSAGGTFQVTGTLRIDQTPTAVSQAVDMTINSGADGAGNIGHRISINANGTTYWIPCSTTAF